MKIDAVGFGNRIAHVYYELKEINKDAQMIAFVYPTPIGKKFAIEKNIFPKSTVLGEPQLGKRGLYPTLSSKNMSQSVNTMMNLISYCDGNTSLLEIGELINEPFWELVPIVEKLVETGVLSAELK